MCFPHMKIARKTFTQANTSDNIDAIQRRVGCLTLNGLPTETLVYKPSILILFGSSED
jgi:hypothetical protein